MTKAQSAANRRWIGIVLLFALCVSAYVLYDLLFKDKGLPVVMESPSFSLPDLEGNSVTQEQFNGQVRLMSFIFTRCPDICPATTANMVLLQSALKEKGLFGGKVSFVSVSFNPLNDTADVLKQYAERMGIDRSGWTLLRSDTEAPVIDLAKKYGISIQRMEDGLYAHSVTSLLLIDSGHRVRKVYRMGEEMDNEQILSDIEALAGEQ